LLPYWGTPQKKGKREGGGVIEGRARGGANGIPPCKCRGEEEFHTRKGGGDARRREKNQTRKLTSLCQRKESISKDHEGSLLK